MEFIEYRDKEEEITNVAGKIEENRCVITWNWPKKIHVVYIYRVKNKDRDTEKEMGIPSDKLRLYTREEYKNRGCYLEPIHEIDEFTYVIYPCIEENQTKFIVDQNNGNNEITIVTGRKKIQYRIKEKKVLFSNKKRVSIVIEVEASLRKDILCYVIKKGSAPINKGEGTIFYFPSAFDIGETVLSEILIGKEEYVNLFFINEEYKKIYQLIPR